LGFLFGSSWDSSKDLFIRKGLTLAIWERFKEMDARDLEAFAQFLQMNGMSGASTGKKTVSFWETFQGKTALSAGLFGTSIFLFRQFGNSLL